MQKHIITSGGAILSLFYRIELVEQQNKLTGYSKINCTVLLSSHIFICAQQYTRTDFVGVHTKSGTSALPRIHIGGLVLAVGEMTHVTIEISPLLPCSLQVKRY